ncbi:MAG: hypothetical protein K6F49_11610 [Saccharofermentans sp.]|nr:hypothetical protein [Saccharofermentans sp.]
MVMKKRGLIALVISVAIMMSGITGCRRKKEETTPELPDDQVRSLCSEVGDLYFSYWQEQDVSSIASDISEAVRDDYLDVAETFLVNDTAHGWINNFYDEYLDDVQIVEGAFTRVDNTASIDYRIIIASYDEAEAGGLISYNVTLNFDIDNKNEKVYISNPNVGLDLYSDMVDDFSRYVVSQAYLEELERTAEAEASGESIDPTPTPTPEPTPTPTPEPTPEPTEQEFEPSEEIIEGE